MKNCFKIIGIGLIVVLVALTMALLPSGADIEDGDSEGVYVLEKDGLARTLDILEENAIAPAFKIDVAKRIESQKINKRPRLQTFQETLRSSLETLGLIASSKPEKVESEDFNVILTVYEEDSITTQSEEARQAEVFTELIGPLIGSDIVETNVLYFKLANDQERVSYINQETGRFGIEITAEQYSNFNASSNTERANQIKGLADKYGISVNQESVATFLKEYSKLIGISPI